MPNDINDSEQYLHHAINFDSGTETTCSPYKTNPRVVDNYRPEKNSHILTSDILKVHDSQQEVSEPPPSRRTFISLVRTHTRSLGSKIQSFKNKNPIISMVIVAVFVSLLAPALLPILL